MSTAYRYARFWAGALTVLGTLFVLAGVLLAIVLILIPTVGGWVPRRGHEVLAGVVMAVLSVLAGALLGGPLIVAGHSLRGAARTAPTPRAAQPARGSIQ